MIEYSPFSLAYSEKGLNTHEVIDPGKLRQVVKEDGYKIVREAKAAGVLLNRFSVKWGDEEARDYDYDALVISATDYNKLAALTGQPSIQPENGKLTLIKSFYQKKENKQVL